MKLRGPRSSAPAGTLLFSLCRASISLPGRDAELGHAPQVHLDPQLALRERPGFRGAHALHGLQRVLEVARQVLELAVRRGVGHQRELHDVDQRRADLADLQARDLGGQARPQRVDLARDLVVLLVGIGEGLELDA